MMLQILTQYHQINQQQWRSLLDQSPTATWFQSPEAYLFYAAVPEEMTPFVVAVQRTDQLACLSVGYITRVTNPIVQYFTCRAIIIGGPLIAPDATDEELEALLQAMRRLGQKTTNRTTASQASDLQAQPIYIETRNFHDYSQWRTVFETNGFAYQPHYDIHVPCHPQHQLSERRQRQLKRAITHGAVVTIAQSEQEVRDWYQILSRLYREKVRTPLFSLEFFLRFFRNGVGHYLLVKHHDKVIGGMMCPVLTGRAIYEWYVCGMDDDCRELSPSVVVTAAAIDYAKLHDLPCFDFMGAGVPHQPYGVRDFKMEFGGELLEFGRFVSIRKPLLYQIGKMGVNWLKRK